MGQAGEVVGTVVELWRYPVQSLRGEALALADVAATGIAGDRAWGIVDPEIGGFVTSARGQRQWRGLVRMSARQTEGGEAEIRLEDGTHLSTADPDAPRRLSDSIGRPVELRRKGEATPVYRHAPLHLLTTATLDALRNANPAARFAPARFRPNLVIDTGARRGFLETRWIGRRLAVGDAVRLVVSEHTMRCVMTTLAQGDLEQDPAVLQTVREQNETRCGVYASVLEPGPVRQGDPVRLLG